MPPIKVLEMAVRVLLEDMISTGSKKAAAALKSLDEVVKKSNKDQKQSAEDLIKANQKVVSSYLAGQHAVQEEARQAQSEWRRQQFKGRSLLEISQTAVVASAAVMGLMTKAATDYIANAKVGTEVTYEWKAATRSLQESYARVGATIAQEALPTLQLAASVAGKVSTFVAAHPELVKAALSATGVVLAVSTLALIAAKGFRLYADLGYILATNAEVAAAAVYAAATKEFEGSVATYATVTAARIAADKIAVAQGGLKVVGEAVTGGAITGGAVAGASTTGGLSIVSAAIASAAGVAALAVSALAPPLAILAVELWYVNKHSIDLGASLKGLTTILVAGVGSAFGGLWNSIKNGTPLVDEVGNSFDDLMIKVGKFMGLVGAKKEAPVDKYYEFAAANLDAWKDYQKQLLETTTQYAKQRAQIEEQYEKQRTDIVAQYAKQRMEADDNYNLKTFRAYRDFQQNESEIERSYYEDRIKAARDNSQKLLEMEQDHQIEMRRDLEDHELTQRDLLESRNGLEMLREDERYEIERQRKEEDYLLEVERVNKAAAQKLRDNEREFALERAQRKAAFDQRMTDQWQDFQIERARSIAEEALRLKELKDTHDRQLITLQKTYEEQLATIETAFRDRLRLLDNAILGDYAAVQDAAATMTLNFRNWLARVAGTFVDNDNDRGGGNAAGGYVGFGQHNVGEEGYEFILSHRTTKLAEQRIGNRLTQANILGGSSRSYVDNRTIQFFGMTEADRAAIRRDQYAISLEVLQEAMAS
jgi:hypothetical protein